MVLFLIIGIVLMTPTDSSQRADMSTVGAWLTALGLAMLTGFFIGKILQRRNRNIYAKIINIETLRKKACDADTVRSFLENYDAMLLNMKQFEDKYPIFRDTAGFSSNREEADMQWHLRDAVSRETSLVISVMKKKYANSKEYRTQLYGQFVENMKTASIRFEGNETWEHVEKCCNKLFRASGAEVPIHSSLFSSNKAKLPAVSGAVMNIKEIDGLDGHKFEYWCADLMRANGFTKVKVTPGSGDQGIDITAVKDGVKYAVQCKNYSGQLGNTPVQEAHTGKTFYKCHVGVVMTNSYFTPGAKELAESTGILLWDRDVVSDMIRKAVQN